MSFFTHLTQAKADPIFGLNALLKNDPRPDKIDLLVGYYRDEKNKTPIFDAIKKAEHLLLERQSDFLYFPIDGMKDYIGALKTLLFPPAFHDHVVGTQTVGGTSALHHLGVLIKKMGAPIIALPSPTWANHNQIYEYLGFEVVYYPYYDPINHTVDFNNLRTTLEKLPEKATVLFHISCHNPSGVDLNNKQWQELATVCKNKKLFPLFDAAYQGLGQGLNEDVAALEIFAKELSEFALAYSCSKNFGLYGQRVGAAFIYSNESHLLEVVSSILKQSERATYSNPPRFGAELVFQVLNNAELKKNWEEELKRYRDRIHFLRKRLAESFETSFNRDFSYIKNGNGLFAFTGLEPNQVEDLRKTEGLYLTQDGRMNLTGLNDKNFETIVTKLKRYL